jgi:CDP-diglyceride synthetase
MRCREALGDFRGGIFVAVCLAVAVVAVRENESAFYAAVPIFFITVFMAVYVTFISIGRPPEDAFNEPSVLEIIASIICAVGSCSAFSFFADSDAKPRFRYAVVGILVGSVFLLFPSAKAELGFVCVPLSIVMSSIELGAFGKVILKKKRE